MKKCLKILLCTFVVVLSVFAMFRINTNAKTADNNGINTIKEEIKKPKQVQKEKQVQREKPAVVKTSTVRNSVPKNTPAPKTNTVRYGTFGRLYVRGYSVALYDYNVNTSSSSSLQTIVNNQDSAAYYINKGKLIIADHYYQGFSVLTNLGEESTAYIKFKDGSIIRYRLIKKARGVNTGPDLVDTNGNSFFNMRSDIIMYTCYGDGIMATLWVLS
ncbi:MAG: hypothetical protein IJL76_03125 [Bacilli bacterium]|nr:hypothetical protein [Bacilli bacterium]